jgi:hypothetical protein
MYIAGHLFEAKDLVGSEATFETIVPGRYVALAEGDEDVALSIDGVPLGSEVVLEAGSHRLSWTGAPRAVVLHVAPR